MHTGVWMWNAWHPTGNCDLIPKKCPQGIASFEPCTSIIHKNRIPCRCVSKSAAWVCDRAAIPRFNVDVFFFLTGLCLPDSTSVHCEGGGWTIISKDVFSSSKCPQAALPPTSALMPHCRTHGSSSAIECSSVVTSTGQRAAATQTWLRLTSRLTSSECGGLC